MFIASRNNYVLAPEERHVVTNDSGAPTERIYFRVAML